MQASTSIRVDVFAFNFMHDLGAKNATLLLTSKY